MRRVGQVGCGASRRLGSHLGADRTAAAAAAAAAVAVAVAVRVVCRVDLTACASLGLVAVPAPHCAGCAALSAPEGPNVCQRAVAGSVSRRGGTWVLGPVPCVVQGAAVDAAAAAAVAAVVVAVDAPVV